VDGSMSFACPSLLCLSLLFPCLHLLQFSYVPSCNSTSFTSSCFYVFLSITFLMYPSTTVSLLLSHVPPCNFISFAFSHFCVFHLLYHFMYSSVTISPLLWPHVFPVTVSFLLSYVIPLPYYLCFSCNCFSFAVLCNCISFEFPRAFILLVLLISFQSTALAGCLRKVLDMLLSNHRIQFRDMPSLDSIREEFSNPA
jgi:hypothetical protein